MKGLGYTVEGMGFIRSKGPSCEPPKRFRVWCLSVEWLGETDLGLRIQDLGFLDLGFWC